MRANRLPAWQGARWVGEGFRIFRAAPVKLLVLNLAFLFAIRLAVAVPVVGFALVWVLIPAMMIGPHALSRAVSQGAAPGAELLVSGFRSNLPQLLQLGVLYLAAMAAILAATALADDGHFARAMADRVRLDIADLQKPELQRAMLIGATLQTAGLAALWYAPLLVAWDKLSITKAVFFSVAASLINWRALLVYGIAMSALFVVVLVLTLGAAMLLGGPGPAQANAAMFAVIWTLLPVWFATSYLSYRDVFGESASGGAAGPGEPAPPAEPVP